jgi:membrane-bound serine protease (ClpP class)
VTGTMLFILGLYVVGMLLIAIEAFVLPGLGAPGIAGILLVGFTAYEAWVQIGPAWGLTLGGAALLASIGVLVVLSRTGLGRRLTLTASIDGRAPYDEDAKRAGLARGSRGLTVTPLRPSGFAMFDDNRVEVRSDGDFVARDVLVQVVALRDGKVFVEVAEPDEGAPAENETDVG